MSLLVFIIIKKVCDQFYSCETPTKLYIITQTVVKKHMLLITKNILPAEDQVHLFI